MGSKIIASIAEYYSEKIIRHGQTPQGVDWNSAASQELRFCQLAKIIASPSEPFSILDLGCGYGAMVDYLAAHYPSFSFTGYDVSSEMVDAAQTRYGRQSNIEFVRGDSPQQEVDYAVASGIFNVRLRHDSSSWEAYVQETLAKLHRTSRRGFAFNMLTSYSDVHRMRDDLYYAHPMTYFDLCKRSFSQHVALLHDYGLYEFTILVRKTL